MEKRDFNGAVKGVLNYMGGISVFQVCYIMILIIIVCFNVIENCTTLKRELTTKLVIKKIK